MLRGYFEKKCWLRCFLASAVEKIFLGTSTKQLSVTEIPDFDIQLKLQTIEDVKTEDDFQNIVDTFPERSGFGVTKFAISFIEKNKFIQQITQYFCLSILLRRNPGLQMGIRTVWTLFNFKSEHFADASKEFSLSQSIISTGIIKLFQTVLYSDTSANGTKKKN